MNKDPMIQELSKWMTRVITVLIYLFLVVMVLRAIIWAVSPLVGG